MGKNEQIIYKFIRRLKLFSVMANTEFNQDEFSKVNAEYFIQCFEKRCVDQDIKFFCKFCNCAGKSFSSKSSAIRHLRTNHKEVHKDITRKKAKKQDGCDFPADIEIRVKVNVSEIWDAIVELVVFNSLSLNSLKGDAFKKLIKPYVVALELRGIKLSVTPETTKKKIEEKASGIKQKIKDETKDKPICLLMDIASRYNRSVLGINIGFILNDCIAIRTIGMHTMRISHTAKEILTIIRKKLKDFDIDTKQIIAFTTDNGSNLVKTARIFDETEKEAHDEVLRNYQELLEYFDSDEEMEEEIFDEQYYSDLLQGIRDEMELTTSSNLIHGVRCGTHCLHLVVTQAIESSTNQQLLRKIRELVKKLRTPKYRNLLKDKNLKVPILDVVTRWNTIFNMVLRICISSNTHYMISSFFSFSSHGSNGLFLLLID